MLEVEPCPQYMFAGMLDKSWLPLAEYEEDIVDVCEAEDHFMHLLCSVNTNFDEVDI